MSRGDLWPTIHAQRHALAADLDGITDLQWATPSLCTGWTVHDVLGHLVATAKMTPPRFVGHFVSARLDFDRMVARDAGREAAHGPSATLREFVQQADRTTAPPGPVEAMLGEALVHPEDIRRPLGIRHAYPVDAVVRALDFYKGSNLLIGAKRRIDGLTLTATDAAWSHGSGPRVSGPAHSLLMAMTGRRAALDDLDGEGVAILRGRS